MGEDQYVPLVDYPNGQPVVPQAVVLQNGITAGIPHGKTGVLILNIGTPATTKTKDVRTYLSKFLGDRRVLDIKPDFIRRLVLQIILLTRPKDSAEQYKKVWDPVRGSPLLYITEEIVAGLQADLGPTYEVRVGMRYSEPSIETALKEWAKVGITKVVLVPNFPQSASSSTGSCLQHCYKIAGNSYVVPHFYCVPPFFGQQGFIGVQAQMIAEVLGPKCCDVDHLLISFHGLPERQCVACDHSGTLCHKTASCCETLEERNRECYRAQAHETARRIANALGIPRSKWVIAFQSRLTLRGRIKWVEPYTDYELERLAKEGYKRVGIVAPSFTVDCLETMQELSIENAEWFKECGGDELVVVPCMNSRPEWISVLGEMVRGATPKITEDLSW